MVPQPEIQDVYTGAVSMTARSADRAELGPFLAANPFPGKLTDGLYFRDKMRAIHRIAPESVAGQGLEVVGGQS